MTEEERWQVLELLDDVPQTEEYEEPQTAIPELAEEELKRNWEELLEPYKRFLAKLWAPKPPADPRQKWICPRCKTRPKVRYGYCDECFREIGREARQRKRERMIAAGHEIKPWTKVQATEETNNTFFDENYEMIYEEANNWAYNIAKQTRDFDAAADYRQDILLLLWKETLYYKPEEWKSPKTFLIFKMKNAMSMMWRKLHAKKREFWDSVLYLEDFVKPNNKHDTWEDFIPGKQEKEEDD